MLIFLWSCVAAITFDMPGEYHTETPTKRCMSLYVGKDVTVIAKFKVNQVPSQHVGIEVTL